MTEYEARRGHKEQKNKAQQARNKGLYDVAQSHEDAATSYIYAAQAYKNNAPDAAKNLLANAKHRADKAENVNKGQKSLDVKLLMPFEKAWFPEAREAAAEARRSRGEQKNAPIPDRSRSAEEMQMKPNFPLATKPAGGEKKASDVKRVADAIVSYSDSVGRDKAGNVVVRRGYFYTHGQTAEGFADKISSQLKQAGVEHEVVRFWNQWKPFRGGDTVAQGSHFGVSIKLKKPEEAQTKASH